MISNHCQRILSKRFFLMKKRVYFFQAIKKILINLIILCDIIFFVGNQFLMYVCTYIELFIYLYFMNDIKNIFYS